MRREIPAKTFGPMKLWCCMYYVAAEDAWYGINLPATDPKQLQRDWENELEKFRVDGLLDCDVIFEDG